MTPEVRRLIGEMAAFADGIVVDMTDLAQRAAKIRDRETKRKARLRTKVNPRVTSVQASKAERLERLREIREALLSETGGRCCVYGTRIDSETMHLHHVIGGGARRSHESALTCAPLSRLAHLDVHRANEKALRLLLAWCDLTERFDAAAALSRRLAKMEEARRVAVKNVGASQQVVDEIAALLPAPAAPSTASGEACAACVADGRECDGSGCPAPSATTGEERPGEVVLGEILAGGNPWPKRAACVCVTSPSPFPGVPHPSCVYCHGTGRTTKEGGR